MFTVARHGALLPRFRHPGCLAIATLAIAGACLLGAIAPARASGIAAIHLGTEEVLRPLQDVRLQNRSGEPMFLGYKVSFRWLGLPYSVSDDGYVLGVKGKSAFVTLDRLQVAEWQAAGHLPTPLPAYRLSLADYVLGHLLWITLAFLAGWPVLRSAGPRRTAQPTPPPLQVSAQRLAMAGAVTRPTPSPQSTAAAPDPRADRSRGLEPASAAVPASVSSSVAGPAARMQPVPIPPAQVARLPVAKTICRVKMLKTA